MWKKKERWTAAALLLTMVVVTGLCWYVLYIRQQFYDEGTRNLLETYEQVDKAFTIFSRSNWNMLNEWGKSLQAANEEGLANTDGLTGLYNERYFDALLKENELNRTPFVLFYLDLDRFKPVNDRYGHDVGDQLLKEVASRLRGCVRESDAVFRIGGDEFALIVNGAVTEGFCKSRVEKIKAAIREPYRLKDAEVQVGTSCGCAVYPCDSDDVRAIRILADHRMYEDKQRSGRS